MPTKAVLMNVKYQIFLSSTYRDLRDERQQVVKAILEMGHIPVGMEMFSAGDEDQWELIARAIDQSDYYVVIVAHNYGSTTDDGISYTEKEYDYAVEKGVPILGFVIDSSAPWPPDRVERSEAKKAALERFRSKVKDKHVTFWRDARDLYGQSAIALGKQIHTRPRPGWIPATEAPTAAVADEISRLSRENAALRAEIDRYRNAAPDRRAVEFKAIERALAAESINLSSLKRELDGVEFLEIISVSISRAVTRWSASEQIAETLDTRNLVAIKLNASNDLSNNFDVLILPFLRYGLMEKDASRPSIQKIAGISLGDEITYSVTEKGRDFVSMVSLEKNETAGSCRANSEHNPEPSASGDANAL